MPNPAVTQEVWTYQYQPFRLGPAREPGMMFPVKCRVEEGECVDLMHGYSGFVFENTQVEGRWHVALLPSGALIGNGPSKHEAIEDVLRYMRDGDKKIMKEQAALSARAIKEATLVARGNFMRDIGRGK